jgi:type IV pilus assembly protein PilA
MKKEMNNKGFSLVELIIVVAIMAVLIGVLAPAYLQYVEKSKKTKDCSAIGSVMDAIEIVAADPAITWGAEALNVSIDKTKATYSNNSDVEDAVKKIVKEESAKITGTWTNNDTTNKIEFKAERDTNGNVEFTVTGTGITKALIADISQSLEARFE